jgi:hypothetical protein
MTRRGNIETSNQVTLAADVVNRSGNDNGALGDTHFVLSGIS